MKRKMIIPVAAVMMLTGCSFGSSIDTLMSPPKLSSEQEQIYKALTASTGDSISLKYPKSGNYLSAFIMEDIDGDGENEAIVFYEKNGLTVEENTPRIEVLDKDDDGWHPKDDRAADGAEIEQVMISKLGDNDRMNIIIGSSMLNRSEKNATIYNYSNGKLNAAPFKSYSFFDVTDIDGDGENEFVLVNGGSSEENAKIKAYKLDNEGTFHPSAVDLSGGFTEFNGFSYGRLPDGRTGLYIDEAVGSGSIQTDIIYMEDNGLKKVFPTPEASALTNRPADWSSFDVDSDGSIEIPKLILAPGYDNYTEGEQMMLTRWDSVDPDGKLVPRYSSYFSAGEGYIFVFPDKWRNKVTVSRDTLNDELVICAYNGATSERGRELIRIYCAEDVASGEDRISMGYMLLRTKGDTSYLAYIPQYTGSYDDDLSITAADAAINFISV